MTPAFAQELLGVWLTTRAVMEPSPVKGCETNWNESALPQISTPAPLTVNVLPLAEVEPAAPTEPMSPLLQLAVASATTLSCASAIVVREVAPDDALTAVPRASG